MKRIKYLIQIAILAAVSMPSVGQTDTLSLSSALEQALENNYGLIISRADVEVAQINNNWGTAGRYPTIGFDATERINYELNSSTTTNRISAGVGLNWLLFDGFRVNITKSKLENLEDLTSGMLAVQVESTIEDIVLGYYYVLLQQERLEVLETVMQLSSDRYQYELKRQSLGGSVTYNVLQAKNVYLTDKANYMNQEVVVRNTIRNLNFFMGLDPTQTWSFNEIFEADTSDYVFGDLLTRMKSTNQVLKNQFTNLLLQENETSLRRASYFPTISMGAGIDYGHNWAWSGGTRDLNLGTLTPYGSARISYDIYSAGVRRRSVEIARINENVAKVEIDQMEHALTNELYNLSDYHEVQKALLSVADENLEAAELNMTISQEKYRSGVINSFNYRDIQLIYLYAALNRLQAVYNLISTNTQLTRITGGYLGYASEATP